MRSTFLFLSFFLFILVPLHAQIDKGSFVLATGISFSSEKQEHKASKTEFITKNTGFGLTGGYFFIDNLTAGLNIEYRKSSQDFDGEEASSLTYNIGPFATYYVNLGDNSLYLPISVSAGYNKSISKQEFSDDDESSGFAGSIRAGLEYIIDEKVGVYFNFGPTFGRLEDKDTNIEVSVTKWIAWTGFKLYF